MSDHPHTRNVQRDDPVTRYQRYSQLWKEQQAPGEKDHRNLRWNVRGHMTQFDNVHKVRYYGDWVMDVERNLLKALCYVTYEFRKIKLPSLIRWLFKQIIMDCLCIFAGDCLVVVVLLQKNRRYFVPNNYIIPGERKHSALRWQIREDLAQGYVPTPSNFMWPISTWHSLCVFNTFRLICFFLTSVCVLIMKWLFSGL